MSVRNDQKAQGLPPLGFFLFLPALSGVSINVITPQQKKEFSYERDRRNGYGENSKSSRKNIRLRKRGVNQANRHAHKQLLGVIDPESGEPQPNSGVVVRRPQTWRKVADIPLGDMVKKKIFRRARLRMASHESVEAAVQRVATDRKRRRL